MALHILVSFFGPNWDEHCKSQHVDIVTDCYRKTIQHNLEQVSPESA